MIQTLFVFPFIYIKASFSEIHPIVHFSEEDIKFDITTCRKVVII